MQVEAIGSSKRERSPAAVFSSVRAASSRTTVGPFRFSICIAVLALVAALAFSCEKPGPKAVGDLVIRHRAPLEWINLDTGLALSTLRFERASDGRAVAIHALRISPALYRMKLLGPDGEDDKPFGWVHEMAEETDALAAVNASFYLPETFEPIGLLVSGARLMNPWKKGAGSGVFVKDYQTAKIVWAKTYDEDWTRAELAVQSSPIIVEPESRPGIYRNAAKFRARTAVGVDGDGRVVLVCTGRDNGDGTASSGLDLYELMEVMLLKEARGGLELVTALNLDGGASSAMTLRVAGHEIDVRSTQPVANGIGVWKRR